MIRAAVPRCSAVAVAALSLAAAGCKYNSPGEYIAPEPGDGPEGDAMPDAMPDVYVHACLTDPTYTAQPGTGRRYKLHPTTNVGTYDDAIDRCAAEGAHLAVIGSAGEHDYLDNLLGNDEGWIGFDDLDEEDIFRWVTGEGTTYLNWDNNEPNNSNGEDCAYIRNNGKWNDTGCEEQRRPLCECDPMYTPPPPRACRMATTGYTTSPSGRRLFARPAATFAAAEADCAAMGAHVLVIGDLAENIEMDFALPLAHWLGITDLLVEGTFRWINSSAAMYRNWGIAVPVDDALDCAVLQDGGGWVNVDCATTNPYVCECDPLPP